MGQRIIHVLRTHLVQGRIPDGVLLGEHVGKELFKNKEIKKEDSRNIGSKTLVISHSNSIYLTIYNNHVTAMTLNIKINNII